MNNDIRKKSEGIATFGLLLVCAGIVAPLAAGGNPGWLTAFKWIYAAGAAVYTLARVAASIGKDETFRVRRLRRLEVWAGLAFCVASFFWFWNTRSFDGALLTFRMLQETILFTLVGALIQIISSWMLSSALKKNG